MVPGRGDSGDGGGQGDSGVVPMVEEEQDGAVPMVSGEGRVDSTVAGRGDGIEAVGVVAAWTR
jgi:hypothetical protein